MHGCVDAWMRECMDAWVLMSVFESSPMISRERFGNKSDRSGGAKTMGKGSGDAPKPPRRWRLGESAHSERSGASEEHQVPDGRVL